MAPLIALIGVTLFTRLVGQLSFAPSLRRGVAALFTITASAHFVGYREDLMRMVPPFFWGPVILGHPDRHGGARRGSRHPYPPKRGAQPQYA